MRSKTRKHIQSKLSLRRINGIVAACFILVFAILGAYLLTSSHAASPFVTEEAEAGSISGSATSVQDNLASGGTAVLFGGSGQLGSCSQQGQATVTGASSTTVRTTISSPTGNMSPAIQTAINSASAAGGGIVKLGPGTYQLNARLTMASNVELEGAGETTTVLQAEVTNTGVVTTNGTSNVTLADFTADQNGQNLNSTSGNGVPNDYEVMVDGGSNVIVEHVQVLNPINYMLDVDNNASAFCLRNNMLVVNGSESKYSNNTYAHLDGIHIGAGTNGDIVDNYADQRDNGATDGDDALVAQSNVGNESFIEYIGNVARGGNNGDCMQFALGPSNISNITVENNEMWGCPYGIRTGGYAGSGSVTNVTISGNKIHNIVGGTGPNGSFPNGGNAIDLGGFLQSGQSSNNNIVSNNYICSAGNVISEPGTAVSGTSSYSGCSNTPTTTSPPPTIP